MSITDCCRQLGAVGAQQLGGDMPWPGRAGMVLAQSWDTL